MTADPKRILIVSHAFVPENSSRAVRLAYLTEFLLRSGWDVSIFTPRKPRMEESARKNPKLFAKVDGARVTRSFPGPVYGFTGRKKKETR